MIKISLKCTEVKPAFLPQQNLSEVTQGFHVVAGAVAEPAV